MKTLIRLFVASLFSIGLLSCYQSRALNKRPADNNNKYKVEYLFEHEGCRVYRFDDNGEFVYFTNCTGDVTSFMSDSTHTQIKTSVKSTIKR